MTKAAIDNGVYRPCIDPDFGSLWRENLAVMMARVNIRHVRDVVRAHRRMLLQAAA